MNRYQQALTDMGERQQRKMRIVKAAAAVAATVIVLWAAGVQPARLWSRLTSWRSPQQTAAVPPREQSPDAVPQVNSPASAAPTRRKPLPGLDSSVSAEPQRLYLVSTAPGRNPNQGTARLGVSRENPQTYIAGAMLVNGARLAEIHEQYVVLERNGERAKMYLESSGPRIGSKLSMVGGEPLPKLPAAVSTDVLAYYLRPTPVYEADVLKGYQVYAGPRSSVFARMGLQGGDVILSLNGQPFSDPQQAIESLKQLTAGAVIAATLERGGKVERVSVDGGAILADQERSAAAVSSE